MCLGGLEENLKSDEELGEKGGGVWVDSTCGISDARSGRLAEFRGVDESFFGIMTAS